MSGGDRHSSPPAPSPLTATQSRLLLSVERLVHKLVRECAPWAQQDVREDLVAAGRYGAAVAASRFDPDLGTRFTSYAVYYIVGEIRRSRDRDHRQHALRRRAMHTEVVLGAEAWGSWEVRHDAPGVHHEHAPDGAGPGTGAVCAGLAAGPPSPDEAFLTEETRALVKNALGELDAAHRRMLQMRYDEDLKLEEIVAALGLSDRTVRRRMAAAHAALEASLRRLGLGAEGEG
ncbi:sigma-70 family RNA polymerase sigma factor [Chondromyces apiculatus]|uniref:Uncharacterized protein n=1 Tax=Chondromyces apiculatus DSM 436 TaxID=1192034 RepID=A0A017SWG3_9BACT|nr:sigma-70 family RNA polymerase sigma factor [Chondromyces apiculatus]EYF01072.1 Hypothetical protein CAP_8729 [Chondromyces apiculatus DSM 436]